MPRKILIGTAMFLLLLLALLSAIPFLFKDKINEKLKAEINNRLNAKVDYSGFSISLFKSFPDISFSLENISVLGVDAFAGDTLALIKKFNGTIDLMSVLKGDKCKVLELNILNPVIYAHTDTTGKRNWDVSRTPPAGGNGETTSPQQVSNFKWDIRKFNVRNAGFVYVDKQRRVFTAIGGFDFEYDLETSAQKISARAKIAALTCKVGDIIYANKVKMNAQIKLASDEKTQQYSLLENSVQLNDLLLQLEGTIKNEEKGTIVNISFQNKQKEFSQMLSLIPGLDSGIYSKIKSVGSFELKGKAEGFYNDSISPALSMEVTSKEAGLQFAGLPQQITLKDLAVKISSVNGTLEQFNMPIAAMKLQSGNDSLYVTAALQNLVDPEMHLILSANADMAKIPAYYPVKDAKFFSGLLNTHFEFAGRKSDVDKNNYKALSVKGNVRILNLVYKPEKATLPVQVKEMGLSFNPENIVLDNFSATTGKSDIAGTGKFENALAYISDKGVLSGALNLQSKVFDFNEWLQKDKTAETTGTLATVPVKAPPDPQPKRTAVVAGSYYQVPAKLNISANVALGKAYYEKLAADNVKGLIVINDEAITVNDLSANLLKGSAKISTKYDTKGTDHPRIAFAIGLKNLDIQQTYQSIETAKLAPVAKNMEGSFSSEITAKGRLNPDMNIDYNSLMGEGNLLIPEARIVDQPVLEQISAAAKTSSFKNLEMKNAKAAFKFKNGAVLLDPTEVKFTNGYAINIQGTTGFDKTIDYDLRLDVPIKGLGSVGAFAQGLLSNLLGSGAPEVMSFTFKIKGKGDKTDVKLVKVGNK